MFLLFMLIISDSADMNVALQNISDPSSDNYFLYNTAEFDY